ncbi:MAG: PIN domain-containing protein [Roseburia faecis]|nr:PIN domain-containing protein [Roseburia faecis]
MRVLVDTNIVLDYLLEREPYAESAKKIVVACKQKKVIGCIAAHTVSNMFFILRKTYSVEDRRTILKDICKLFDVEGIDRLKIIQALDNSDFKDFEDCLQMQCAKSFRADYILTRNLADYRDSEIACISPEEFCEKYLDQNA